MYQKFYNASGGGCHASHEACELKSKKAKKTTKDTGHASHEACELKSKKAKKTTKDTGHASHEACELKF